jgi:hypothetical protein
MLDDLPLLTFDPIKYVIAFKNRWLAIALCDVLTIPNEGAIDRSVP